MAHRALSIKKSPMKKILLSIVIALMGTALAAQTDVTPQVTTATEEEVFVVVEEDPEFPGGMDALYQYLASNIRYPKQAKEEGIQGRVFVNFVIEKDGSVSNVKVLRDIGGGCAEEAMRVVQAMPKWKPGRQRGKRVRTQYTLPINFNLK